MRIKEIFIISKGTKVILAITFSVSLLAIIFAFFYYRSVNRAEDPRVTKAREYLNEYEKAAGTLDPIEVFPYLDSANVIYRSFPDYKSSFETGVIFNNKCSMLLLMALYDTEVGEQEKKSLLDLAMKYCDSSIIVYKKWISEWDTLSPSTIAMKVKPYMNAADPAFEGLNFDRIFSQRIKNIITAQIETPRRLSVSLSNKGTIYRHLIMPDSALSWYNKALSIWEDNRTARSNMSVLMGGEPVKPTVIESLFPPDKNSR
jgi:tetratricopeptide (TPR) repeat protein